MIPAEQNYETYDAELLAIVKVFEQWRHYLEGAQHTVEVWTDHDNLRGFMKVKELNARQRRWVIKLAAVDFDIFHRPGKTNPADPPSRRPDYEGVSPQAKTMLPTLQRKLDLVEGSYKPVTVNTVRVLYALRGRTARGYREPSAEPENSKGND